MRALGASLVLSAAIAVLPAAAQSGGETAPDDIAPDLLEELPEDTSDLAPGDDPAAAAPSDPADPAGEGDPPPEIDDERARDDGSDLDDEEEEARRERERDERRERQYRERDRYDDDWDDQYDDDRRRERRRPRAAPPRPRSSMALPLVAALQFGAGFACCMVCYWPAFIAGGALWGPYGLGYAVHLVGQSFQNVNVTVYGASIAAYAVGGVVGLLGAIPGLLLFALVGQGSSTTGLIALLAYGLFYVALVSAAASAAATAGYYLEAYVRDPDFYDAEFSDPPPEPEVQEVRRAPATQGSTLLTVSMRY